MSFAADSGGGWGVPVAAADDTWNTASTNDWGTKDSLKKSGGDDFGSSGFNNENDPNFASDEPKQSGCFNCGEDGHNKADCPQPRKFSGTCNNCNEEGHMSKDCPSRGPMVCRSCSEEGHMSKDCPTRGPLVCSNCNQEGHSRAKCENARVIDRSHVPDATPDDAWEELQKAIKARYMDDVKDAIEKYSKASPEMTYVQLQEGILDSGLDLYLIAKERPLLPSYTNMDLQGNLNKKYTISYRFSDKPERPREADGWPADREELLSRLHDAGIVVEQSVPHCSNCNEMGHIRKHCRQEVAEVVDRPTIKCYNCDKTGHRMRDCPQPRSAKGACRNCGKPGHKASDCEEPRSAANIDCRKCGEMGHFSRDCPQGGSGGKRTCHTCGSEDHLARECPDKKDKGNDFFTKDSKTDDAGDDQNDQSAAFNDSVWTGNFAKDGGQAGGDDDWNALGSGSAAGS